MIKDSGPVVVVTQSGVEEKLGGLREKGIPVLRLDTDGEELAGYEERNLGRGDIGLAAEHLGDVIYTWGSTGRPKGVMIEHRGVGDFLAGMGDGNGGGAGGTL